MKRFQTRLFLSCAAIVTLGGCLSSGGSETESSGPPVADDSNTAPTITGTPPAAVSVGSDYSFTPSATDADGDPLTFSVSNLPGWANFSSATGQIDGRVTLGDAGMYRDIVVTVSDGRASASLRSFDVEVVQFADGSVALSWSPPAQNTDGTPADLSGYRIYYGVEIGVYPDIVDVTGAQNTSVTIDNLVPDTYYFVGTAVNVDGLESDFSSVLVRTVD